MTASVEAALTAAKEKLGKSDYKGALADAQAVGSKIQELPAAAAAKKAELTKAWESLSVGMPKVVDAIKSRLDILSKSKKLPAGMTADKLAEAKSGLGEITQQWTEAAAAAQGGKLTDAIAKATSAKTKAADVLTMLGMPVPDALKS